jgi:hypothetical protein
MAQEEVLKGGNVNHIVRISNTVRRPIGYWSRNVHVLLKHLEKQGFEGAPRFLGVDDSNREILTFIPGEVAGDDYPKLKLYMWSDETLIGLARLLRAFHDATKGISLKSEDTWQLSYADENKHEVICHNDAALYNVVFQQDSPVALIDFDMACPAPRLWDIAYTLYTSIPLGWFTPDCSSGTTGVVAYQHEKHAADRRRRIHLFFESYGIPVPNNLNEWIIQRLTVLCDTMKSFAANGKQAFQKMIDEGQLTHYESEIRFVTDHFEDWI